VVTCCGGRGLELVVLAGFMRLLSPVFTRPIQTRIMNITQPCCRHSRPSCAEKSRGLRRALSGCTVHFVNEECDEGPIIIQAVVPVFPDITTKHYGADSQAGTSNLSSSDSALRRRPLACKWPTGAGGWADKDDEAFSLKPLTAS